MSKKQKKEVLFCRLCGFIADSPEELDFHYSMEHEPDVFDSGDWITEDDVW